MRRELPPDFSRRVEILAVGASAGGIDALFRLFGGVRPGPRVPVAVVLHLPPGHDSQLAPLLTHRLQFPAVEASPGQPLQGGRLHLAPPGYHLLVEPDRTLSLSCEPPVHWSRPSIDVLLQSCAHAYGPQAAAIVLTGANADGAAGLAAVAQAGGLTAVQDPAEAAHPAMPLAAITAARPDFVLPLDGLRRLARLLLEAPTP
jgi:two-component system chemotaxis response regulator CheB